MAHAVPFAQIETTDTSLQIKQTRRKLLVNRVKRYEKCVLVNSISRHQVDTCKSTNLETHHFVARLLLRLL